MDVRLILNPETLMADVRVVGGQVDVDDGLETSLIISLFSKGRARVDDELPYGDTSRGGWWGDTYSDVAGDRIGSRLWLLDREKQLPEVVARAREYAREAVQWLIDDGIAEAVEVEAEVVSQGVLGIGIKVIRPSNARQFRFQYAWAGQAARRTS